MIKPVNFPKIYTPLIPEFKQALGEFISNGEYIGGSLLKRFEDKIKDYLNVEHVVGCKSGTHALQLALLVAGIGHGDEVITTATTYYATVYAIMAVGATPVFCEVLPSNGLIDPSDIKNKLTSKTKAILPVHLYGIPVNLAEIKKICNKHKLLLIEDCAHAFGSEYHGMKIGTHADFACFSLYPTKNLGALGDAGMVISRSSEYADRIRKILYLFDYKNKTFHPQAIHAQLDSLQAALLMVILKHWPEYQDQRKKISDIYKSHLSGIIRMALETANCNVSYYVFPVFTERREELLAYLRNKDIHLQIHYNYNLHCLPQFGNHEIGTLPITEKHNREVLSLPMHPSISIDDAKVICKNIIEFFEQK